MFTLDNTEGFTELNLSLMNRAVAVLTESGMDEKNASDLINNNWRVDAENTIESLTKKVTAGRPQLMTGGKAIRVYLDTASLANAKLLGNGNVSEGIRIALQRSTK